MHRGRRPRQPQALKSSSQAHLALLAGHSHPNTYDNPDPNAEWPSATLYDLGLESAATCIYNPGALEVRASSPLWYIYGALSPHDRHCQRQSP
jgi:hypothetical protein